MEQIRMTLAKFKWRDSFQTFRILFLGLLLILFGSIFYLIFFPTKAQVSSNFSSALAKKDYISAYRYVYMGEEGVSLQTFKQWQTYTPNGKTPFVVKKVPSAIPFLYVWKVDLPTRSVQIQLPFSNVPLTIDGISNTSHDKTLTMPLYVGTHVLQVQIAGISQDRQVLQVASGDDSKKPADPQITKVTVQPSSKLKLAVQNFLSNYNQAWCQAVNARSPDGILPYLTGKNSSEYQFITEYIQSLKKQNWMQDKETLKNLSTTQVNFEDSTHIKVHTTEIYHHDTRIIQDHDNWVSGARKEYDDTVMWIYEVTLLNDHTFQIESLHHPAEG